MASKTEDIFAAFSKFTKLSVVARNSTFAYKGKPVDIRQIGKELGARYVLEGSVRRMPQRIRITAQLIGASDGKHLWAQNYDRELKHVLSVQDGVIQLTNPKHHAKRHSRSAIQPHLTRILREAFLNLPDKPSITPSTSRLALPVSSS